MNNNTDTDNLSAVKRIVRSAALLPDHFYVEGQSDPSAAPHFQLYDESLKGAEEASYGKRGKPNEPFVDGSVRKTLQVKEAGKIPEWGGLPDALVRIADTLTPGHRLEAEVDRLLIYRPGDFFARHRDGKKDPKHVLTLSVICAHDGNNAPHSGGRVKFPARGDASWDGSRPGSYAAWYNTEEHEVTEVREGYRVAVTYNVKIVGKAAHRLDEIAMANQTESPLSGLPAVCLDAIMGYLDFKGEVALGSTCRDIRKSNYGSPLRGFARMLRSHREDILSSLRETGSNGSLHTADTLSMFLKHEYSFNYNQVEPSHLRGCDAILAEAVSLAFPKCVCAAQEAFLKYKEIYWDCDSRFEGGGWGE